jgi:hypothetical protein
VAIRRTNAALHSAFVDLHSTNDNTGDGCRAVTRM